jgi:DNA-binding transcriptional MocR family regulator
VDTAKLLEAAKQEGVSFVAGPDFMIEGGANALRLSFAPVTTEQIPEGIDRLARALASVREGAPA